MRTHDLRPGNLFSNGRDILKVANIITDTDIPYFTLKGFPDQKILFNDPDIHPIPLTEEWLIRFGFVLDKGIGFWLGNKIGEFRFVLSDRYSDVPYKFNIENKLWIAVKYVHQLQNLYFDLMGVGEELTINN